MITEEQEKWLAHLSNDKMVEILPYNPKSKEVFKKAKNEIKKVLNDAEILHRGSTALGISGQGEVDLYIPIKKFSFENYLYKLAGHFGKAGSVYPLKRARFVKYIDNIKVEIFLVNEEANDWKDSLKFEDCLRNNQEALKEYEELKESSRDLTIQEYYRKKTEFINRILGVAPRC